MSVIFQGIGLHRNQGWPIPQIVGVMAENEQGYTCIQTNWLILKKYDIRLIVSIVWPTLCT